MSDKIRFDFFIICKHPCPWATATANGKIAVLCGENMPDIPFEANGDFVGPFNAGLLRLQLKEPASIVLESSSSDDVCDDAWFFARQT